MKFKNEQLFAILKTIKPYDLMLMNFSLLKKKQNYFSIKNDLQGQTKDQLEFYRIIIIAHSNCIRFNLKIYI